MNKPNGGTIYTNTWVAELMLDLCDYVSENDLAKIKVVDPSCGEGSFSTEIVSRLCQSMARHRLSFLDLADSFAAYDTDCRSLVIARDAAYRVLREHAASADEADYLSRRWFHLADFIESDQADVDLVIGNPPYIRATDLSLHDRQQYAQQLQTFTFGTDIYIAFLEKGLRMLSPKGKVCFICSDRWQKNQYGTRLRRFITDSGRHISFNCQMYDVAAFAETVAAYPAITTIESGEGFERNVVCSPEFDQSDADELLEALRAGCTHLATSGFTLEPREDAPLFGHLTSLEDAGVSVGIGLATGKDQVFITQDPTIVEPDRLLPIAYARDITEHKLPSSPVRWLVNPWSGGKLVDLQSFPRLQAYFDRHQEELMDRYVAKKKPAEWYRTIDKPKPRLLRQPKLLLRDLADRPEPVLDTGHLYPHHNLYWLTSNVWDLEVLGGILISDFASQWMRENSVTMRGGVIRNQAQYLRKLKVPEYDSISLQDREDLKRAFNTWNVALATSICKELYANG
ncbi:Eco57I restriction-modification methylase domain-containing protein [Schleiferilactobacillus harbinensis]|uniref:Eco57I restriction-modification methylase domain-containing protein n=1 Tax=Schleiferilactobacillus harbinensis TaxID=304207 RepID=UPI0039E96EA6